MNAVKTSKEQSKSVYDKVKSEMDFVKAPECLVKLDETVQGNKSDNVTAEEFADYVGTSRQTIWNYIKSDVIPSTRDVGDKTNYVSLKTSLIPMCIQTVFKKMNAKLFDKQITVICLNKSGNDLSKTKALLAEKFPESTCISMNDIFELTEGSLNSIIPIEQIADRVKKLAEDEVKILEKKYEADKTEMNRKVEELITTTYKSTVSEYMQLLKGVKANPEYKLHCDIEDFIEALGYLAQQKATEKAEAYQRMQALTVVNNQMTACKQYKPEVDGKVGEQYEKLYRKAYRQLIGDSIKNSVREFIDRDHMMLYECKMTGDLSDDMSAISDAFDSIKFTGKTLIVGYEDLDPVYKAYIFNLIKNIEKKGAKYKVSTM